MAFCVVNVAERAAHGQDGLELIRFADGPSGRRARLIGTGKDVREVIAVVGDNDGDVAAAADYLEMPLGLVQAAVAYYGGYRDEIDEWISLDEEDAREHATWLAGQAADQWRREVRE